MDVQKGHIEFEAFDAYARTLRVVFGTAFLERVSRWHISNGLQEHTVLREKKKEEREKASFEDKNPPDVAKKYIFLAVYK